MPQISMYFQLHQPYRLQDFSVFNLGHKKDYFIGDKSDSNKEIFHKVSQKSYLPMLSLLKELLVKHKDFYFTLSCSGIFLEQAQEYEPKVIELLQDLAKTGRVEFLAETYYHSLSFLYSQKEFKKQVDMHVDLIEKLFSQTPKVFRNTELIYSNDIADAVNDQGFIGMLTEAVDRYLHYGDKTQLFRGKLKDENSELLLLLKHAQLADDIAFRFGNKSWISHPLSAEKYVRWVEVYPETHFVNLFMDFETFGEHQWEDTGIFEFFAALIEQLLEKPWNSFVTPTQVFEKEIKQEGLVSGDNIKGIDDIKSIPIYDVPEPISWADVDRDLTAWIDNDLQQDSLRVLYDLEDKVLEIDDDKMTDVWRKLQTSDHFYYMFIKCYK